MATSEQRLLDLGTADVHLPAAMGRTRKMATISTPARKALKPSQFALPEQRKYPLPDAAHARNAAARLEQEKKAGKISSADYATAKRAIARASRKFGVTSEYNKTGKKRQLHVRADLADGGSLHIRHMSDEGLVVQLPPVDLTGLADSAAT